MIPMLSLFIVVATSTCTKYSGEKERHSSNTCLFLLKWLTKHSIFQLKRFTSDASLSDLQDKMEKLEKKLSTLDDMVSDETKQQHRESMVGDMWNFVNLGKRTDGCENTLQMVYHNISYPVFKYSFKFISTTYLLLSYCSTSR